jgi:transglutaminase superfamily protein
MTISPRIRFAIVDGLYVILDLQSEQYLVLNDRATMIWHHIVRCDGSLAEAGASVGDGGDPKISAAEQNQFELECRELGFLLDKNSIADVKMKVRSPRAHPSAINAWWSLVATALRLRLRGFEDTYDTYDKRFGGIKSSTQSGQQSNLGVALSAFLRAENFIWLRSTPDDCLPRSLSLFRFLRSLGFEATHRIGGRRVPTLTIHAWVDLKGESLLEDDAALRDDTLIASLPHEKLRREQSSGL